MSVFAFFSRDFMGSVRIKNPCFFGGFPCHSSKKTRKGRTGLDIREPWGRRAPETPRRTLPRTHPVFGDTLADTLGDTSGPKCLRDCCIIDSGKARGPVSLGGPGSWYSHAQTLESVKCRFSKCHFSVSSKNWKIYSRLWAASKN